MKRLCSFAVLAAFVLAFAFSVCPAKGAAEIQRSQTEQASGSYTEAYEAYLDVLYRRYYEIELYFWQKGYSGGYFKPYVNDELTDANLSRQVAFADIWGDETPELIYISAVDSGNSSWHYFTSDLHVLSFEDGAVRVLYEDVWDVQEWGASYFFFKVSGDKQLYIRKMIGDNYISETFSLFTPSDDALELKEYCSLFEWDAPDIGPDEYSGPHGEAITKDRFLELRAGLLDSAESVIMYGYGGDFVRDFVASHGCAAMSINEATDYLENMLFGSDETYPHPITDLREFLMGIPGDYEYYHDMGMIDERLHIYPDGTADGGYHDMNLGEFDDPGMTYDSTEYYSDYTFRMENVTKESRYSYSFTVRDLVFNVKNGDTVIVDDAEYGVRLRRVAVEYSAFSDGDRVTVYTDKARTETLPNIIQHLLDYYGREPGGYTAGQYSVFNEDSGAGFIDRINENKTGIDSAFEADPKVYSQHAATVAAMLSLATYQSDSENWIKNKLNGYGFEEENIYTDNFGVMTSLAVAVAVKPYYGRDARRGEKIIVVAARGSTNLYELLQDAVSEPLDVHGYQVFGIVNDFRKEILDGLKAVVKEDGNYRVFLTGHSLGGAAVNCAAALLPLEELPFSIDREHILCYSFAAVNSIDSAQTVSEGYEYIHNVYNLYDTFSPAQFGLYLSSGMGTGYGKFGHLDLYMKDRRDQDAKNSAAFDQMAAHINHDMDNYLTDVREGEVEKSGLSPCLEPDKIVRMTSVVVKGLATLRAVGENGLILASAGEGSVILNSNVPIILNIVPKLQAWALNSFPFTLEIVCPRPDNISCTFKVFNAATGERLSGLDFPIIVVDKETVFRVPISSEADPVLTAFDASGNELGTVRADGTIDNSPRGSEQTNEPVSGCTGASVIWPLAAAAFIALLKLFGKTRIKR